MESKVKEEPASPPSPRRKQKRAESPLSPPPQKESGPSTSPSSRSNHQDTAQSALAKVRRLLYTLLQHGEEMGMSTAEKVKSLLTALVGGSVTLEEFQSALHETTGCPLRPFVVPYLQAYLPILQHDFASQSRGKKQGILEYLSSCEAPVFERDCSPSFSSEVYGKRKHTDRPFDDDAVGPSLKRPLLVHPIAIPEHLPGTEEQWRNIHVMLNCTLSMVEKTKQALSLLQHGQVRESTLEEERLQQTVRLTEERIQQIKKKAEDAITEIKRKAAQEIEKAAASIRQQRPRSTFQDYF